MSFDNRDFFEEDFIEQSKKKTVSERKIDFPEGKFGKGIRMSYVPDPPDETNMSGIDLDLITAILFNTKPGNTMGYNEPFIWGSGRINPRLGAVAFWAKGKLPFAGPLFEQTTISFGRKERDLIGVMVNDKNQLSAYVRDARYVRHELNSAIDWDASVWNHIVLNWDWANGIELWLNGNKIASSYGTDGWFETAPPGLFHLPAPGIMYDELYLMDRPVSQTEIKKLISSNVPPKEESPVYVRKNYDSERLAQYSGADKSDSLPVVSPNEKLIFTEVWPTDVADGHIPGPFIIDGRNEMAWPHDYAFFTIIPGDGDFHAEKVDIKTPPESKVNYVFLTGNLTNVKVQTGSGDMENAEDVMTVPPGNRFLYGSKVSTHDSIFRIPFTEEWGTPSDFNGDLHLPLSGEKRVHDIGLYNVNTVPVTAYTPKGDKLTVTVSEPNLDKRTRFAINALTSRDERKIVSTSSKESIENKRTVDIGAFSRLSILSEPYEQEKGITELTLSLPIKTLKAEETLFLRVRDPAIPSRLWNQFALKIKGFDKEYQRLVVTIDFQDMVVSGGDRIWLDLGTVDKTEIKIGDKKDPAELFVSSVNSYLTVDAYAEKELISANAQYSKQYEFMPWQFTGRKVSIEEPYCYGGSFDMLMPALAVARVQPDNFVANYLIRMSGPDFKDGKRIEPEKADLITLNDPYGAPGWAMYMRDFNKKRWAMIDWWSKRQNPDGQIGGGWNDDTLFGLMGLEDIILDGNDKLLRLTNNIQTKFELTRIYKDGYCNIYPIDRLHTADFISERYNTVVNNLGQAYAAEREMEPAWRLDKPDQTPTNYAQGIAFRSPVNVLNWYWGKDVPNDVYVSKPLNKLEEEFRQYTSVFDDFSFYRMTASRVMIDDFVPYGSNSMYTYMLGGVRGTRHDAHLRLAVTWPSGGGPDVARVILKADNTSLDAAVYSFDSKMRNLKMRLCRIDDGYYRIGLYPGPEDVKVSEMPVWTTERALTRFDTVNLPIPPRKSLVIKVEQIKSGQRPSNLADLAIDHGNAVMKGTEVTTIVHNIGNERAENIVVRLLDGERIVREKTIEDLDAPIDFVAKKVQVTFSDVPKSKYLKVIVDPENNIREILKDNNSVSVEQNIE